MQTLPQRFSKVIVDINMWKEQKRVFSQSKRALDFALASTVAIWFSLLCIPAQAEYGDVVLNIRAEKEGVRPVIFSHWFHRIRFRCKVCHSELGFKMRAGSNDVLMADIINGKFCGMCHNDSIAWGPANCDLCHSGKPGLKSGMVGGATTGGPGRW